MKHKFKTLMITAILLIVVNYSFAQDEQVAMFKDGTSVAFTVLDSTVDHMKKFRVGGDVLYTGLLGLTGGLFANYFDPIHNFMGEANYQFNKSFDIDGAYYFIAKKKMMPVKMPLKYLETGYNTATVYEITTNIQKATYFGVDVGYEQDPLNYQTMKWHEFYANTKTATYYLSTPGGGSVPVDETIAPPPTFGAIAIGPSLAFAAKYRLLEHELTSARRGAHKHVRRGNSSKNDEDEDSPGEPAKDQAVRIKGADYFVVFNASVLIYTGNSFDTTGMGSFNSPLEEVPDPPGKLPLSKTGFRISYSVGGSAPLSKSGKGVEFGYYSMVGIEKNNAAWNLRVMTGILLAF